LKNSFDRCFLVLPKSIVLREANTGVKKQTSCFGFGTSVMSIVLVNPMCNKLPRFYEQTHKLILWVVKKTFF
jgi:hypothetical protein